MQCPKCNAENEDGTTICNSCGESIEIDYPRAVFLNQTSRADHGAPINFPLETMAFLELGKHKRWVIICLGVIILFGFIVYFFK